MSDLICQAMESAGTPVSKSRIQGWRVAQGHKNYRNMSSDELLEVLEALMQYFKNETNEQSDKSDT